MSILGPLAEHRLCQSNCKDPLLLVPSAITGRRQWKIWMLDFIGWLDTSGESFTHDLENLCAVARAAAVCITSSAKFMDAEMLQLLEQIFGISVKESEIEIFKRSRSSTKENIVTLVWQKYSHCVIRTFSHLSTMCYSCCLPSRRHCDCWKTLVFCETHKYKTKITDDNRETDLLCLNTVR